MDLGEFSVSLTVNDIAVSLDFYNKLGFELMDGSVEQQWLMLRNGETKIGLFQGIFEDNVLTFNSSDARGILASIKSAGIETVMEHGIEDEGPAHFVLEDPDGNNILIDQF